jgi:hypothetical protein
MNNQPSQQEESGTERALGQIRSLLIEGETLEAWTIQRRLFALL